MTHAPATAPASDAPDEILLLRIEPWIAISNDRLLEATDDHVSFTWKDDRSEQRRRVMTLEISEFVRRFLLHVLPHRFVKIRNYGLLAQSQRALTLPHCPDLLGTRSNTSAAPTDGGVHETHKIDSDCTSELVICPNCQRGRLVYDRPLPAIDSS